MSGVGDYLVAEPLTITADADVYAAVHLILSNQVSGIVVVDHNGMLLGMLSELDCLRAMVTSVYNGGEPGGALVGDIMIKNVVVNRSDENILEVASSMLNDSYRRRPVLDKQGRLTGQITCRQILKAVTKYKE